MIASWQRLALALLSTLVLLAGGSAAAADGPAPSSPRYYVPDVPADMGPVEFYLLTAGVGREVNDRFGHTGIRIRNPEEGTDVVFNWGKFSFDDPGFLWKFYRGQLTYSMGVRTFQGDVMHYMQMNRHLVMDKLNLTTRQKRRLMEKIAWNAVPENRTFAYQYWYKNCSTIPRDYLDEVLEGQVRSKFFSAPAGHVFRDYMRKNLEYTPFVASGLDILMNANIDRPITMWEEMFLPGKLRDTLLTMPSVDDEGNPVPGTHLLGESQVLLDNPEAWDTSFNDYLVMAAPTSLLLLGALALFALRRGRPASPVAYRLLGGAALTWGLFAGIIGLALTLNWALGGHSDGWHNVNLLLFWPVDLLFVPIGLQLLRHGRPAKDRRPFLYAGRGLCYGHALLFVVLTLLAALHVVEQDVWRVVGWFALPLLGLSVTLGTLGFSHAPEFEVEAEAEAGVKGKLKVAR